MKFITRIKRLIARLIDDIFGDPWTMDDDYMYADENDILFH